MLKEHSWVQAVRAFLKGDALPSITVQSEQLLERVLSMEIVRVTERAAVSSARLRGKKNGPKVDIAVDPLEGTNLCAMNMAGSIATLALAEAGTLLHAPDCYMEKIAIGPGYPKGTIDLDAPCRREHHQSCQGQGRETV
jgi:fructose-1,6-bisphosphatase II / sedoheptulose-1,7-bisphosphatase